MDQAWNLPIIEIKPLSQMLDSQTEEERKRPAAILTGQRAWNTVRNEINLPVVVQAEPYSTDVDYLNDLAEGLPQQAEVVYGIGGGLVADVAKYVAYHNGIPAVIVPTVLSVDGFFTPVVAAREKGTLNYIETGPAARVIVDMRVVTSAPRHLRGTGIVELLSMTTGLRDWSLAAEKGQNSRDQRFQPWAAQVAASIAQQAYKIARSVGAGNREALRNLLDLLAVEVQLTNQLGHNRPQEGSEQYFAYAIEPKLARGRSLPWADLMGPGILLAAALQGQNVQPIRSTLDDAGVRLDQLPPAIVRETLLEMADYVKQHDLPYGIFHEAAIDERRANELMRGTGLDLETA